MPEDGQSAAAVAGPEIARHFDERARTAGAGRCLPPNSWTFPWTALPLKVWHQDVNVQNSEAARLKHTYVHFTAKAPGDLREPIMQRIAGRARTLGWHYRELAVEHFPLLDKPHEVATLLRELV